MLLSGVSLRTVQGVGRCLRHHNAAVLDPPVPFSQMHNETIFGGPSYYDMLLK